MAETLRALSWDVDGRDWPNRRASRWISLRGRGRPKALELRRDAANLGVHHHGDALGTREVREATAVELVDQREA